MIAATCLLIAGACSERRMRTGAAIGEQRNWQSSCPFHEARMMVLET